MESLTLLRSEVERISAKRIADAQKGMLGEAESCEEGLTYS